MALYCSAISSICGNEISLGVGHPLSCNRGHPYGRFYGHYGCLVHSYGDRTKKLEILKDPHLGAFAVICAVVYLLLYTGSMYEFCENARGKAMFYPVLFLFSERVFSGLSVVMFPSAKNNGLAAAFSQASEKKLDKKILLLSLVLLAVLAFGIWGVQGLEVYGVCLVLQGVLFAWYDKWSKKNFGGITGDPGWIFPAGRGTDMSDGSGIFIENNVKISELVKIS